METIIIKCSSFCVSIIGSLCLYACLFSFCHGPSATHFTQVLLELNLSTTSLLTGENIYVEIANGLYHTIWLTIWTMLSLYPLAFVLAFSQKHYHYATKPIWYVMTLFSSIPTCFMFVLLFTLNIDLSHLSYPYALAIILLVMKRLAPLTTFIQSCLHQSIQPPHVEFARQHVISPTKYYLIYYLPSLLQPVYAKAPKQFAALLCGGTAIVEMLCSIDGLGRLSFVAMKQHDYPVIILCLILQTAAVSIAYYLGDQSL